MKTFIFILCCLFAAPFYAQNSLFEGLYAADYLLANKAEIGLSKQQENSIVATQNEQQQQFGSKKHQLDKEKEALQQMIASLPPSNAKLPGQFERVLTLESELKMLQFNNLLALKGQLSSQQIARLADKKQQEEQTKQQSSIVFRQDAGNKDATVQPLFIIKSGKNSSVIPSLDHIKPDDIDSIEVFKGERAIENYGQAGANGVVLITLKKGTKY